MRITWTEEINLSDKEVEIILYLAAAKNNMYTWYSSDHTGNHPFSEYEARSLITEGFIRRSSDYNFGDVHNSLTHKGIKLAELIGGK